MNVCIIGSTGYAGQQLASLLSKHPKISKLYLGSHGSAGKEISDNYKHFKKIFNVHLYGVDELLDPKFIQSESIDFIFFALPHGLSTVLIKKISSLNVKIIDLGADLRLKDVNAYNDWYGIHESPELLNESVYGLTEHNKKAILKAQIIANPGCYATATLLGAIPAVNAGLIGSQTIIVDAKSGISGAGRVPQTDNLLAEASENLRPYSIGKHRHTPEIEQELNRYSLAKGIKLMFSPSVVPMSRGLLSAVYAPLEKNVTLKQIKAYYEEMYKDAYFVRLVDEPPVTKAVRGSNYADIWVGLDERTNTLIAMTAIDNLMKGAAGQAVQNMNIMMGFTESLGLDYMPLYP